MTRLFDRIVIAVPDLDAVVGDCRVLFDAPGWTGESTTGMPVARWGLPNTVIELVERGVERPCIQGIVFTVPGSRPGDQPVANVLGLDLRKCDGHGTEEFRGRYPHARSARMSVDHVVLRTEDAGACIALFGGELGIRLALDQTVPEWGGRMLFFRGGKLTLEIVESGAADPRGNHFWGLAYQCGDLEAERDRLRARGAVVSPVRAGRKPGTRVATLKSHCLDIPTLLLQPVQP